MSVFDGLRDADMPETPMIPHLRALAAGGTVTKRRRSRVRVAVDVAIEIAAGVVLAALVWGLCV